MVGYCQGNRCFSGSVRSFPCSFQSICILFSYASFHDSFRIPVPPVSVIKDVRRKEDTVFIYSFRSLEPDNRQWKAFNRGIFGGIATIGFRYTLPYLQSRTLILGFFWVIGPIFQKITPILSRYNVSGYWWAAYLVAGIIVPLLWGWVLKHGPWSKVLKRAHLI